MSWLRWACPHLFGWSYNTSRRRRWCRACAQQQRLFQGPVIKGMRFERWVDEP